MNDLQKVELELFKNFVEVCEKLNLQYFMLEGSALGAARHQGFIPWDDDLDVGMYREDYNLFMESAQALLPEGIFLQNYKTDPEYPYIFAKLRNSNTTFIEKALEDYDINHGVYLDIFPLDGYTANPKERKKFTKKKRNFCLKIYCGLNTERTGKAKLAALVLRFLGYNKRVSKTLSKYEKFISQYPVDGSLVICNHGSPYAQKDYINAEYYGKGTLATFEGIDVRIPENYDGYLTCIYKDWRMPPPPEKQNGHHYYSICDLTRTYSYYSSKK